MTTEKLCQGAAVLLQKVLDDVGAAFSKPGGSPTGYDLERLLEATKALTGLVTQMRQLDEAEASKARRMTFEEQVNAFEHFFEQLPEKHREALTQRLDGVLIKRKSLSLV